LEYLPIVTKRTKWFADGRPLQVGDLVLIVDENAQRNVWERGIVEELHTGPDNKTRSASVRTSTSIRKRPVAKLAVILKTLNIFKTVTANPTNCCGLLTITILYKAHNSS
jgi:hypothetical protein